MYVKNILARKGSDVVSISPKSTMIELAKVLRENKIGTQVLYIPVNEQPYYQKLYGNNTLPGANRYYKRTLSLPLYPTMICEDVEYVVNILKTLEAA